MQVNRRRFLTISAAAIALAAPARAANLRQIHGQALGARITIALAHPDADRIAARALDEIARLERIFSLFRDSDLVRLNRAGRLNAPPFELLECVSLCGRVHAATQGAFDPTIQPLWATYAEHHAAGAAPDAAAVQAALAKVGWEDVRFDESAIVLRPGMALTLNGIAQGYIGDRVAALLQAEGLTDIFLDTGEFRALGGHPNGGGWPVTLDVTGHRIALRNTALSSSAPLGTTFDQSGTAGHILDPRTGLPAASGWRMVSVTARRAALADALSTAFCLLPRGEIDTALAAFADARLVQLV